VFSGRGKQQQQHELSYARKRVSLASVVPSRKMKKFPLFVSSNCGGERSRNVVVKVSEGGTISLPHGWPSQKVSHFGNFSYRTSTNQLFLFFI